MAKAPDNALPAGVRKKYVLDGEKVIFAVNQHWIVVSEPVITVLAVLVITVYLDMSMPGNAAQVADVAWWIWFGTILRALFYLHEWRHEWFIATDKRMMRIYGTFDRQVAMMPLAKVTDMRYDRSIPGRVLGYGTYIMESAGQVQALSRVPFVPHPDHNYRAVVAEMFGVADEGAVDEDEYLDDYDDDGRYDAYDEYDDGRGPDTVDDLPAVQVEDRHGDLRTWRQAFEDRYDDGPVHERRR